MIATANVFSSRSGSKLTPVAPFKKRVLAVAVCIGLLTGCATQNQTGGVAIGAILGAVAGQAIGGKQGALIGAALGAGIGMAIGKNMDEADRKKLAEAKDLAIRSNVKQTFFSPSAKANVLVEPSKTYLSPKKQEFVFDKDMKDVPLTVIEVTSLPAFVDTPIYSAPDYSQKPKLLVTAGSQLTRIAMVEGSDWFVVGQGEYGLGYVHKDYFDQSIISKTNTAALVERKIQANKAAPIPSRLSKVTPSSPVPPQQKGGITASGAGGSMLDSNTINLPPNDHFSTTKTTSVDFANASSVGAKRADAVKQGNSSLLTQAKMVSASTQCRELVTTLLQDNKAVATEKSTACSTPKGWM